MPCRWSSRLPPCLPGMALVMSSPPVATPTTPTIGLTGNRISSLKWTTPSRTGNTLVTGDPTMSMSWPNSGMMVATPWGPGRMSRISTIRLSPGSAPRTATGPVAGLTFEKSISVTRSLSVCIWPEKQSWVSKVTTESGLTSSTGFISGPKLNTASSFGITWSTLSMVLVTSISFLAARRGRICFGRDSLVLDKDLLGLGDGLRTPGCGESQRYKAQYYPDDGEVITEPHRVVG